MPCSSNLCGSVVKINEINKYRTQMTWMALDRARCIILIKTYMGHFQKNVHSHGKDTVEKKLKEFQFKMVDLVR